MRKLKFDSQKNRKLQAKDGLLYFSCLRVVNIQGDTKKRELLKNPTKIEEIQ